MLGKFNPDQQLDGIVGQASKLLSAALGQIGPGSGGIGGLIQGGLSFLGAWFCLVRDLTIKLSYNLVNINHYKNDICTTQKQ